jgi:hypothetical protein
MSVASDLVESFVRMPELLGDIALNDPIAAVLVGLGGLIIAACVGVMGYLSLGALVELVNPMSA